MKIATPPAVTLLAVVFATLTSSAAPPTQPATQPSTDWPQFRGPNRDGVSRETGLLKKWPDNGPPKLWTMEGLGNGVSALAIVGHTAYTLGGNAGKANVVALDLDTQKILWQLPVGTGNGQGERAAPNVVGNRLYFMTCDSLVGAVDLDTHKILWSKHCRRDLKGDMQHIYGYSETPLIDGDKCIFTPGAKDAAIMAVNKETGEVLWKMPMPNFSEKGPPLASYSSLVISQAAGVRQYVTLLGRGLVGVDAATGKFLWGYDKIAVQHSNIPTPLVVGDYVWGSNAYGGGTACLKIVPDVGGPTGLKFEEQYYLKPEVCQNLCGQSVILGDYVYTGHGMYAGEPMCLEWKTGKIMWHAKQPGRGVAGLIAADGMLYFRAENGEVSLIEANPKEYKLVSTFKQEDRKTPGLSHPVISNGKLYLRDGNTLSCFDLRDPSPQITRPFRLAPRTIAPPFVFGTRFHTGTIMRRNNHSSRRRCALLESLESRTLLTVTLAPGGTSATFTDVDGDLVTVKISKGAFQLSDFETTTAGSGEFLDMLDVSADAVTGANISITVAKKPGGNGLTNVGYINATGKALGAVSIAGDLGRIAVGDATTALKSLSVRSIGRAGRDTQPGAVNNVNSNFSGTVGSISVKTDIYHCSLHFIGNCGPVTLGGSLLFAKFTTTGNLGLVKIAGDITGDTGDDSGEIFAGGTLGGVTLGGSLLGGAGLNAGSIISTLAMGPVKIGGSVVGNAGMASGNILSNASIAGITIAGSLVGGDGPESGRILSTLSAGNISIGGSIYGGTGQKSGNIDDNTSTSADSIKIAKDIIGGDGDGDLCGAVFGEDLKSFTLGGSIIGGNSTTLANSASGNVEFSNVGTVKIGGDLVGSGIPESGFFSCDVATSVTIGGALIGGDGDQSGGAEIFQTKTVLVGGDIVGGRTTGTDSVNRSGYLKVGIAGSITVNGSVIAGTNNSTGTLAVAGAICIDDRADSVTVKGSLRGTMGTGGTTYAIISAEGDLNPLSSVNFAIKTIKIGGSVDLAQILAGYGFMIDKLFDFNHDVQINSVSVGGEWSASSIAVGAKNAGSANVNFGTDDTQIDGGNPAFEPSINSITIAGEVNGTPANVNVIDHFGFVTGHIGTLKIDGNSINPASNTALGSAGDFTIDLV